MMNRHNLRGHVRQIMLAGVLTGASSAVMANDFSIDGNAFTLSGGGGFNETLQIDGDGTIGTPDGEVPQSSSFGMPNFSFEMVNDTTGNDGEHVMKVGVVIYSTDDTDRRIEAYLSELILEVDGDSVTGRIPDQNLTVRAQGDSLMGEVVLNNADTNGPITLGNSSNSVSVSFSGDELVNRLKDATGETDDFNFDRLFSVFDQGGDYQYRVVVEEDRSPTGITPAATAATFSAEGTALTYTADAFTLDPTNSGSDFDNNFGTKNTYSVNGAFTVAATPEGDSGGDNEEEETPEEQALEASNAAKTLVSRINDSSVPPAGYPGSLSHYIESVAQGNISGANSGTVGQVLLDASLIIGAMADVVESGADFTMPDNLGGFIKLLFQEVQKLVPNAETGDAVAAISNILSFSATLGVELDEEFETLARGVSQKTAAAQLRSKFGDSIPDDVDLEDPQQLNDYLADNEEAQGELLDVFPSIRSTVASSLGDNAQNPKGITLAGRTALQALQEGLEQQFVPFPNDPAFFRAIRLSDLTVRADRNTGIVTVDGELQFRPSYYVRPMTPEDVTFREENGINGVAFRAVDVNGDGRMDYEVLFEEGIQVFYAVP